MNWENLKNILGVSPKVLEEKEEKVELSSEDQRRAILQKEYKKWIL